MTRLTVLLALCLTLFLSPVCALAQSLAGSYDVWGRKVDGDVYEGTAEVRDNGETVTIFWDTTAGVYSGAGIRSGPLLVVDIGADHMRFYRIMRDGELHGTWGDGYAVDRLTPR